MDRPPRCCRASAARLSLETAPRTPRPFPACTAAPGCSSAACAGPSASLRDAHFAALEIHVGLEQQLERIRLGPEVALDLEGHDIVAGQRLGGGDTPHRQ